MSFYFQLSVHPVCRARFVVSGRDSSIFTPELIAIPSPQAEGSETTNSGCVTLAPPRDIEYDGTWYHRSRGDEKAEDLA